MHSPGLHFLPLRAAFAPTGAFVVRRILFFFLTPLNPQHAAADGTRRTADSGNRRRCTAAHNSAPVALMESSAPHSPYASSVASRPIGDSSTIRNWACGGISPTAACCTRMCRRSIRSRRRLRHGMPQAPRRSQQRRLIPTCRPKRCAPASRPPTSRRKNELIDHIRSHADAIGFPGELGVSRAVNGICLRVLTTRGNDAFDLIKDVSDFVVA